jgi:hypothetical protein
MLLISAAESRTAKGGDEMKTRKQALQEEFDDLEEEFYFCGDRDERRRCAGRMQAILGELSMP